MMTTDQSDDSATETTGAGDNIADEMSNSDTVSVSEAASSVVTLPSYRIIEGTSPALEFECPAQSIVTAASGAFLAKSPHISVYPSPDILDMDCYENTGGDTEILYLSPSSTGSLIAFDMQLHRRGLILSAASFFASTENINVETLLDLELSGIQGPYRLHKATGEGVIMAFMSGDLFPISLEDNADHLQVDARALAAMETSISFELEQLSNGQYVASLAGPGRIWLQSMPTQ